MKKNKIFKVLAMVMILTMLFSVNVFATETQSIIMPRTQSDDGEIADNLVVTYTDRAGETSRITFAASCDYTVAWEEGYYGWVYDAVFSVSNTKLNENNCTLAKQYDASHKTSSIAYMDYLVNYQSMYIRVQISCDEWGDVSMAAYEIEASELCADETCTICNRD